MTKTSASEKDPQFPSEPVDAVVTPVQRFIHTEVSGGLVLLLAAGLALFAANSSLGSAYEAIWQTSIGLRIDGFLFEHSLRHWINDGLVTLFFFVVGLEIKREIVLGELSVPGALILPAVAAAGGMVVPAALYLALVSGPEAAAGWGAVMATDIAFVVGGMALLGKRIPRSLYVFMLSLAIADDVGAILVIAVGYSHDVNFLALGLGGAGLLVVAAMRWLGVRVQLAYWGVGLLIWLAVHESGVHATVVGVALGLLTPVKPWVDENRLNSFLDWGRKAKEPEGPPNAKPEVVHQRLARAAKESLSTQQQLEARLHPWTAFIVLPLFALANAGIAVSAVTGFDSIALATAAGLAIGKPFGIVAFTWLAVTLKVAALPKGVTWSMLLGAGMLAGIGFTMALFVAQIAFQGAALDSAKLGILAGSLISALAGLGLLFVVGRKPASVAGSGSKAGR
ncbi:MAG: Na+/H+ antiporter NhaA [Caulobacter sp.]|nr:Na+/H+ antiporter NhaA [Caulobacter sp.]